jgi:hypothetical protein
VSYEDEPEWLPGEDLDLADEVLAAIQAATPPLLQDETFSTTTKYDALNRVTEATAPDVGPTNAASVTRPRYNEANLLEAVYVSVRGATEAPVITDVNYNARGQRVLCAYANGTVTTYEYDPTTADPDCRLLLSGSGRRAAHRALRRHRGPAQLRCRSAVASDHGPRRPC